MTTASATVSRWTRLFVVASLGWFVCWQAAAVAGAGRRATVTLGLYGFVLHTVFGKGYALVPSYFDRRLAVPRAPAVHLPLALAGTGVLAATAIGVVPAGWHAIGAGLWALGCLVFVGTLGWSVRDNLTGRETGTTDAKSDRRGVDRLANAFVPVAAGYLLVAALLPVARTLKLVGASVPAAGPAHSHLLAAGAAALLLFAVGFRLLPRFLVAAPRPPLVAGVLAAGALGPVALASSFGAGRLFRLGAGLEAAALVGFAVAYADMLARSDRRRIGLVVLLAAAVAAAGVAALGLHMAWGGVTPPVADAHTRLALLGFLGLAVVGVSYQFYPPAIASVRGVGDRTAAISVALVVAGVGVETGGTLAGVPVSAALGRWLALFGAVGHATVLLAVFWTRRRGR
ncbi:hypothetical protein [Halolamina rubra]|uniref:hypothetical protein n=1 Tax=Halolamina rubra TaxID=1380430 RepID=UPI000679D3F7|nr:hypothetical protein [Halolamina rubra]